MSPTLLLTMMTSVEGANRTEFLAIRILRIRGPRSDAGNCDPGLLYIPLPMCPENSHIFPGFFGQRMRQERCVAPGRILRRVCPAACCFALSGLKLQRVAPTHVHDETPPVADAAPAGILDEIIVHLLHFFF